VRRILAAGAAAAVGALGALILGEYPFTGVTVLVAAVIFGLFIGETAMALGGRGERADVWLTAAVLVVGVAAMMWAAWISTGRDLSFLGPAGWTSIPLAGATAATRSGLRTVLRKGTPQPAAGSLPAAPAPAVSPEERPA